MKKIRLVLFSLISLSLFSCASKDAAKIEDALAAAEEAGITQDDIINALAAAETLSENGDLTSDVSENAENIAEKSEATESANTETTETTSSENDLKAENFSPTEKLIVENPEPLPEIEEPEVITLPPEEEPVKVEVTVTEPEIPAEKIEDDAIAEVEAAKVNATEVKTTEVAAAVEDVIDIEVEEPSQVADIETETTEENTQAEEPAPKQIIPSRSVTLKKLEYLDITYPGNGWIYMGITDGSKDLTYFGRKVGTENTKFSVQAKLPGTKILHFYKNDTLTNTFIDDYIEVVVLDEKGSNKTHIAAPEYKTPVTVVLEKPVVEEPPADETTSEVAAPKEKPVETKPAAKSVEDSPVAKKTAETKPVETVTKPVETKPVETVTKPVKPAETKPVTKPVETKPIETKPVESEPLISNDDEVTDIIEIDTTALLKEIKELYKSKNYKDALDKIEIFMENSTDHRDEALFYQGQIYEAKSQMQNIQAAINAYTTLTKNYPASKYWDDANKRIIYLKRFYLEGR